jgi:acetolactate synthase-1/2/3 large subunit
MNGAESLARTLVACGIDTCFANPGTSEMHFVSALDRVSGLRCVLGLAETAVAGFADGYGRLAGKPAATLFHCGPGLANAVANLHNARRGFSPILNIVGDQATYHQPHDAPLTFQTETLAKTVSKYVRVATSAKDVGMYAAQAIQAARQPPCGNATLVVPADCAWNEGGEPGQPLAPEALERVPQERIRDIAKALRSGQPSMLVLSNDALTEAGLKAANRVAHATGAQLRTPTQVPRMQRGRGRVPVDRIPYLVDAALQTLSGTRHLVLAGAKEPVGFFAYPGKPSTLWPKDCTVHTLAAMDQDIVGALEALADELGAPRQAPIREDVAKPELHGGPFKPEAFGLTLSALLPENAVIVEDAVTSGRALFPLTWGAPPHDWIQVTGGAIGYAFPSATGAAVACPGRKVVCLQADGGGMYSLQALWTQAREQLDVINVVFANRRYAILQSELAAVGAQPGPASKDLLDLSRPELRWTKLAEGMGVEAVRVETLEAFTDAFSAARGRRGPFLIEFSI